MKKIDDDYWTYRGYEIYLMEHPKLYGKYEIYRNDVFIGRVITLKEGKELIKLRTDFLKKPFY